MKEKLSAAALAFIMLLLCSCGSAAQSEKGENSTVRSDTLFVRQVENFPADFILGMDVSSVISEENSGVRYFDFDGNEKDLFAILAENGINAIRVRIWNDPYDSSGNGYGGGNCDISAACEIGRRAADNGMGLIVDFHYSDFWADPGKQFSPKAWQGMNITEKSEAVYTYTCDCLHKLLDAGANIRLVQLGNETNGALAGEKMWYNIRRIMESGSKAVREICPNALIAVHFANPENEGTYASYAQRLAEYELDYDVFASSYYPYWHGTLENLASVLSEIAETYGKKVMVMETSYAYTPDDFDFSANTISNESAVEKRYPYTVQGQANSVRDVIDTMVNRTANGIGVCYWEGAWIPVGTFSREENSLKWEKYGSGWASSYAAEYDPNDAGKYYGGSAVDNQAFFDKDGKVLESLKVFSLVRTGNEPELLPDAIKDSLLEADISEEIILPETAEAIMTDGSLAAVPVTWNVTETELAEINSGAAGIYEITGTACDLGARLTVLVHELNLLENGGFETGDTSGWTITDTGRADELYVKNRPLDSLSGECHLHFWSAGKNSVDFSAEQTVDGLQTGTYKYSISIQGGDAGECEVSSYVLIDGTEVAAAPLSITWYNNWDTAVIEGIRVNAGQRISVGIRVKCSGSGSGAWGMIDDAVLSSQS